MNLLVRLLMTFGTSLTRPRLASLLDTSTVTFRVLPNDLDLNGHMTNGRYLSLMDLGRIDLVIRTGLLRLLARRRWRPILGAATIRFRRGLAPFERYQLHTRIVCWDAKWFYVEQRFERNGKLLARGYVQGLFRGPNGNVPSATLLEEAGLSIESPPMPEGLVNWLKLDPALSVVAA